MRDFVARTYLTLLSLILGTQRHDQQNSSSYIMIMVMVTHTASVNVTNNIPHISYHGNYFIVSLLLFLDGLSEV